MRNKIQKKRKKKKKKLSGTDLQNLLTQEETYGDENMHSFFFGLVLVQLRPGRPDTHQAVT